MKSGVKQIRVSDDDKLLIRSVLMTHGKDPAKHFSRFVLDMFKGLNSNPKFRLTLRTSDMADIKKHFINICRLGTNLNQISHSINTDILKFQDTNGNELITLNQSDLMELLNEVKEEVVETRKTLQEFIDKGAS